MTELLLKNKKLINKDLIIEFKYNNEIFDNQINDLIKTFKKYYNTSEISKDDKEYLFNCIRDKKGILEFYENVINNFMILIEYLNNIKKEEKDNNDIKSDSIIYQVLKDIEDSLFPEFLAIFKEREELKVNKTCEIFIFVVRLMFSDIKDEIKKYQEQDESKTEKDSKEQLDEKKLEKLNLYFIKKDIVIGKGDLENAIKLFISLVLFREKDKENKIKLNRKNLFDYLKSPDLWDDDIYDKKKEKFKENLSELSLLKIQINQTLWLYNYLVGKKENDEYKEMENNLSNNNDVPAPEPLVDDQKNLGAGEDTDSENDDDDDDNDSNPEEESDKDEPDR